MELGLRVARFADLSMVAVAAMLVGAPPAVAWADQSPSSAQKEVAVRIPSRNSLVHMGSVDSTNLTKEGTRAAKLVLDYLETGKVESARSALAIYEQIIPKENYGGDYTALQWLVEYKLATPAKRSALVTDVATESFRDFFVNHHYAALKEYLKRKYKLGKIEKDETVDGIKRRAFLEDFILFDNPRRESWEKTSEMMKALHVGEGSTVADVGSGPGYFTFRFSRLVGERGKVYAIDTVKEHSDFVRRVAERKRLGNIVSIQAPEDHTIGVGADQVDVIWLCSLYHIIYVTYVNQARDQFVESMKKALRKDGLLYVVDNGIVPDGVLPYHGPYIEKDLLIGQFQQYGFRLVEQLQFIPQRYILVFKKA